MADFSEATDFAVCSKIAKSQSKTKSRQLEIQWEIYEVTELTRTELPGQSVVKQKTLSAGYFRG